jgi:hypothetical protein
MDKEFHNLHSSPNILKKSWREDTACVPAAWCVAEDSIKVDFKESRYEGVEWIHLARC